MMGDVIVTFNIFGTNVTTQMSEEEFMDTVLNNHGNLVRHRYPYTWKRVENATVAEKKKIKVVKINDDNDAEVVKAKKSKVSEDKFKKVKVEIAAEKKKITDKIKLEIDKKIEIDKKK